MRLFLSGLTLIVMAWLTAPDGTLAAAKPRPKDAPVIVTFVDGGNAIQSDGGGDYQDAVGGVVAYINADFDNNLVFASNTALQGANTDGRQLWFDFSACLWTLPEQCSSPFSFGNATAQIVATPRGASGAALPGGLLGLPVGLPQLASTHIRVMGQPADWTLCMNLVGGGVCGNSTSSTYLRVTRNSSASWTFSAKPDEDAAGRSDVADLLKTVGSGKRITTSLEGTFSMPFEFTVTCVRVADCQ